MYVLFEPTTWSFLLFNMLACVPFLVQSKELQPVQEASKFIQLQYRSKPSTFQH
jgi:hypothetical protein